jgi:septum formation protein
MGIEPEIFPVGVDETVVQPDRLAATGVPPARIPHETCLQRSRLKMDAAEAEYHRRVSPSGATRQGLMLTADTVVSVDGLILDKPETAGDAEDMIRRLSGRTHSVFTAVVMTGPSGPLRIEEVAHTHVTFCTLDPREVEWYLRSGQWQDVAGGYRIQGVAASFVTRIDGSYSAVMGLPIHTVYSMIKRLSS